MQARDRRGLMCREVLVRIEGILLFAVLNLTLIQILITAIQLAPSSAQYTNFVYLYIKHLVIVIFDEDTECDVNPDNEIFLSMLERMLLQFLVSAPASQYSYDLQVFPLSHYSQRWGNPPKKIFYDRIVSAIAKLAGSQNLPILTNKANYGFIKQ